MRDDEIQAPAPSRTELWLERAAGPEASQVHLWSRRDLLVLALITILAGFLRLWHLGQWSFWIDEVHTIRESVLMTVDQFWETPQSRYPLGFLLLRWIQPWLPGVGEGHYRLLFAFFGIASIPLAAVVFRPALGPGKSLLTALLLAVSPWHIYWSQSVRAYAIIVFLALGAYGAFRVGIEKGKGSWLFLAVVLAGLATLAHASSLFLILAFLVFLLLVKQRWVVRPRHLDGKAVLAFLIPLVIIGVMALFSETGNVAKIMESYSRAKGAGTLFHLFSTASFHMRVAFLVTALFGGYLAMYLRDREGILILCVAVVPLIGVSLSTIFAKATAYYILYTLPFWSALAAIAIVESAWAVQRQDWLKSLALLPLAVIIIDLGSQTYLYHTFRHGHRPQWRAAVEYLQGELRDGDVVASTNSVGIAYYLNPYDPQIGRVIRHHRRGGASVQILADWKRNELMESWVPAAAKSGKSVWLIFTEPEFEEADPDGTAKAFVQERFRLMRRYQCWVGPKDMTVYVYRFQQKS